MSVVRAFNLRFLSALRIGAGPNDEASVAAGYPSDTLSAALVVTAAEILGDEMPGRSLGEVARDPPWALSSLLPWVRIGERIVRFVPRPTGWALGGDGTDKAYRRVAFVSTEQLTKVAPPYLSRCGTLAHTTTEIEQMTWLARAVRPSVTLDRVTSTPHLFHLEELWIATGNENAGASIVVRTADQVGMNLVRTLLRYLADSGIGADRARGLGRFVIAGEEELSLDDAAKPERTRVLLGCASPDEMLRVALSDPRARYTVTRREGRAHGARGGLGVQRKTLRMLAPGAVVPDRGAVMGRTQDVTPDGFVEHRIYRDGRTLGWVLPERRT